MTYQQITNTGATGVAASLLSVITTLQEQLDWWIRISGGLIGLTIAIVTLIRLLTKPSRL